MYTVGNFASTFDENFRCHVLKLPYRGGAAMLVVLAEGMGEHLALEDYLSTDLVDTWLSSMETRYRTRTSPPSSRALASSMVERPVGSREQGLRGHYRSAPRLGAWLVLCPACLPGLFLPSALTGGPDWALTCTAGPSPSLRSSKGRHLQVQGRQRGTDRVRVGAREGLAAVVMGS